MAQPGTSPKLEPASIERLTRIWQRVLQRSPIGAEEHFADLGGRDELADVLFAEIAQEYGLRLPSATIGHAPTVAALAALLEEPLPRFSPFVEVRAGNEDAPIFIAHGLSGTVEFHKLGKCIRTKRAIYGIQAQGVDGLEEPFDRVEDMAKYYLDALEQRQPTGAAILVGYSFGGLVALEMAQGLVQRGRTVGLLVLVDTFAHPRYLPGNHRRSLFVRRVRHHLAAIGQMPPSTGFSYLTRGVRRKLHFTGAIIERKPSTSTTGLSFADTTPLVNQKAYLAYRKYRPKFYPGKIHFIGTQIKSFFPGDPSAVWGKLAAELNVEIIPGDHLEIVTTKFEPLAAALTNYLEQEFPDESK
jgi:acetoacetyl-CoA synthetase